MDNRCMGCEEGEELAEFRVTGDAPANEAVFAMEEVDEVVDDDDAKGVFSN